MGLVKTLIDVGLYEGLVHPSYPQQITKSGVLYLGVSKGSSLHLRFAARSMRCCHSLLEVGKVLLPPSPRASLIVL